MVLKMKALRRPLSRRPKRQLAYAVAAILALSSGPVLAQTPSYVTGMDMNHTYRISPTNGPPSENNALEVYPHFTGPGTYAPSATLDRNGNLVVNSCVGCGGSSGVNGTYTCPTVTITNGIITAASSGSCGGGSILLTGNGALLTGNGVSLSE
jgi:hypothetical protein